MLTLTSIVIHGNITNTYLKRSGGVSFEPHSCIQAIHEKIESLDLNQVHAKIKQVDSHSTLGNGIVIQVSLCMQVLYMYMYMHVTLTIIRGQPRGMVMVVTGKSHLPKI